MTCNNTIEPRLIALLNNVPQVPFVTSPSLELPPLHDPNILKASGRPLLLEPNTAEHNKKPVAKSSSGSGRNPIVPPLEDDENACNAAGRKDKTAGGDRALSGSSPQSLRKILDDNVESTPTAPAKKRQMAEPNKDEFVQLPQPPKKQKTAMQVVPPIINGLFEPPPQAALFPPIASSSFHDSHGRNTLNTVPIKAKVIKEDSKSSLLSSDEKVASPSKSVLKRKSVGTRKKWTEVETNNLLLGVHKHGVGCWTDILGDATFSFNNRSAADLKDRFRTCCPAELRGKGRITESGKKSVPAKPKSSLMSENILIDDGDLSTEAATEGPEHSGKTRAHRKNLEDLVQLGIEGPFRMSQRRERRTFSEAEDRAILEGFKLYGPAWAKIQRDPRLNLQSRQPTDLRDRVRNKFQVKCREETKETTPSALRIHGSIVEEPSTSGLGFNKRFREPVNASVSALPSLPSREGLRIKDITSITPFSNLSMDTSDQLGFTQSIDWNPGITAPYSNGIGEMDISRLLLDEDGWDSSVKEKQSFSDLSHILTSNAEPIHSLPSFLTMLNDPDPIDDLNDGSFG